MSDDTTRQDQHAPQERSDDRVDIVLPGSWVWIPLGDDERMTKAVAAMVRRQLGAGDRLATKRRTSRDQVVAVAKDARAAGAISFAMALELAPGVPFPASLMMTVAEWPLGASGEGAQRLRSAFPSAVVLEQRGGAVAREANFFQQRVDDATTPTLRCEYWLPTPDGTQLLGITISAPSIPEQALFTELFDAIVETVTWTPVLERVNGTVASS